ncbi:MAG TPA: FkbM family methyltransferase [Planctomycetes bacterium]|nr:FkbM family methyltransferase [Planctomycetota bacterium]
MTNRFSSFMKKKLLGKNQNLVSINEPYGVMSQLLKGCEVTGIIDAGASDGRISKRLLRKFPAAHIYAFEPNPFYTETLQQYAKKDSRFHPQFLALSDHEGNAALYVTESPGSTSLFTPANRLKEISPQGASVKSLEKVKLVTIDEWAKRNDNPDIQLMKFDIQAAELRALRGAVQVLKSSALVVYTEICFNPIYKEGAIYSEIDLFFREYGFALYDIFKPKYGPNGLILWGNAIFLNLEQFGI